MFDKNLLPNDLRDAINKLPNIIGVGPSAWPRIIPGLFFPKYKIICNVDCGDNQLIRDLGIDVFSIKEKDPFFEISPESPGKILDNPVTLKYLRGLKEPFTFLVYKSSLSLEKLVKREGWKFIGNPKELAEDYIENKKIFKEIINKVGLEAIPGENVAIDSLNWKKLKYYQKTFGQDKLVLQMAEMTYGGGSGTLFVENQKDYIQFKDRVLLIRKALVGKKKKIVTVNIAPFIEGISSSISCCATKHGILVGPIQTQIIDIPEVGTKLTGRSGNFAGHDWSYKHHLAKVQYDAARIAERFGEYIYKQGYKGIFGLDLIIDKNNKVWPVECNPRYTDAFPLISMLFMEKGLIPFDIFHCLEHLNSDYRINVSELNKYYQQNFSVSQILIHSKNDSASVALGSLKPGIYKIESDKLIYQRPGIMLADLNSEDEYLFTERVPDKPGRVIYPMGRIFRMIKRGGMLLNENTLKPDVSHLINKTYKALKMIPAHDDLRQSYGIKTLFTYKIMGAIENPQIKTVDLVNVLNITKEGFRRPYKITWRKSLTSEPVISQIRSKRSRKQIKSDINKIAGLGIEIKTLGDLDEKSFGEWFKLYKKIISAKDKGYVIIDADWLKKKQERGKKAGAILAVKEGKIIGGDIFFEVNKILGVGYGVCEKIPGLNGGLGLLLDYYFLVYAQKQGYKEVSFGQDTNFYGSDLSIGLLAYKAKLGLVPMPSLKSYWLSTYFLNLDKFKQTIMFFSGYGKNLELSIITKDKINQDFKKYLPSGVSEYKIYIQFDIVVKHRKLIQGQGQFG